VARTALWRTVGVGLMFGVLALVPDALIAQQAAASPQPGSVWRDQVTGMEFVWVPGGTFEMGCGSWDRECFDWEKPPHRVTVSGFWLGKTEVTQGQWTRIIGSNPSKFTNGDDYPVEQVDWDDAQQFISKLNSQSGGVRFRLPTEAEWEYACRAGGKEQVNAWGNGEPGAAGGKVANLGDVSAKRMHGDFTWLGRPTYDDGFAETAPVANFAPNGLGLFDMSGNVFEWVQDAYQTYSGGTATAPSLNPAPVACSGAAGGTTALRATGAAPAASTLPPRTRAATWVSASRGVRRPPTALTRRPLSPKLV
jgi:formylglycine-generating enzyme required for sulfatase activity